MAGHPLAYIRYRQDALMTPFLFLLAAPPRCSFWAGRAVDPVYSRLGWRPLRVLVFLLPIWCGLSGFYPAIHALLLPAFPSMGNTEIFCSHTVPYRFSLPSPRRFVMEAVETSAETGRAQVKPVCPFFHHKAPKRFDAVLTVRGVLHPRGIACLTGLCLCDPVPHRWDIQYKYICHTRSGRGDACRIRTHGAFTQRFSGPPP